MKRLVLVGGGHAQVEVLLRLGQTPVPDLDIVLVSPVADAPYSGMLPGLVAGRYSWGECHIDLASLARHAGARLLPTRVVAINPVERQVMCADRRVLTYDVLSLDIGSVPPIETVEGAAAHGVPVKPVDGFLDVWNALVQEARDRTLRVIVVGGGAGGVELILAMRQRLLHESGVAPRADFTVVTQGSGVLSEHPAGVRRRIVRALATKDVGVLANVRVVRVSAAGLTLEGGAEVPADCVIWATGAAAPAWLRTSGLALDDQGFVLVDDKLQSVSHPGLFATGDVATMRDHPRPKSGVFAVRQGPPLAENLRLALADAPLKSYRPQRRSLSLISTGGRHAVASWGGFAFQGAWVWHWKDAIDRKFMARYDLDPA
ncbi:MAG: FAD-dependent oxidoreductase [Betaproteobacteria bacterium]